MLRYRHGAGGDGDKRDVQRRPAPGKVARTQQLAGADPAGGMGALGLVAPQDDGVSTPAERAHAHDDPFALHLVAEDGVSGSPTALPHLDAIQRSFGPAHDVSQIEAHVGGAAADAADEIGARAYATGASVAFREQPDLFTAAHEAAHVVQQRAGVHLAGGVGVDGDTYEQHADAVAERVVRGESAADLLAPYAGGGSPRDGVQRAVQRRSAERSFAVAQMDKIKAAIAAEGGLARSNGAGAFATFTGITQEVLRSFWEPDALAAELRVKKAANQAISPFATGFLDRYDKGTVKAVPNYTTCMELTGGFAESQLGLGRGLRQFELDKFAPESWVPAAPGRFPQEGDLVRLKSRLHMRLSYNAPTKDGDDWWVIESGQNNGHQYDAMHFKKETYSTGDVLGWMDIDKRANHDFAAHLAGTWEVTAAGTQWLYTFASSGNVVHYVHVGGAWPAGTGTWEPGGSDVLLTFPQSTETWPLAGVKAGANAKPAFKKLSPQAALKRELEARRWQVKGGNGDWIYTFSGNRMHWTNADGSGGGEGTWTSSGRVVTLGWKSGTVETWTVPSPVSDFTYVRKGVTYRVTPM
jgi:hypothetical protein